MAELEAQLADRDASVERMAAQLRAAERRATKLEGQLSQRKVGRAGPGPGRAARGGGGGAPRGGRGGCGGAPPTPRAGGGGRGRFGGPPGGGGGGGGGRGRPRPGGGGGGGAAGGCGGVHCPHSSILPARPVHDMQVQNAVEVVVRFPPIPPTTRPPARPVHDLQVQSAVEVVVRFPPIPPNHPPARPPGARLAGAECGGGGGAVGA